MSRDHAVYFKDEAPPVTVGVVVTTLGLKTECLQRLFQSIPTTWSIRVAVQGPVSRAEAIRELLSDRDGQVVLSSGGISAGRNDALRCWPPHNMPSLLLFPNDDTYYPHAEELMASMRSELDIGLIPVRSESGLRAGLSRWGRSRTLAHDVMRSSHEPGMVVRRDVIQMVGGFDETISLGSRGVHQSGEGADLVARSVLASKAVGYIAHAQVLESSQESGTELKRKRLKYARGALYVLGLHSWMTGSRRVALRSILRTLILARSVRPLFGLTGSYLMGRRNAHRRDSKLQLF